MSDEEMYKANKEISEYYGLENRLCITMEEAAELIQACNKIRRAYDEDKLFITQGEFENRLDNFVEESADVLFCITSVCYLLCIDESSIEDAVKQKLERTLSRIEEEKKKIEEELNDSK
ncbi:MAG: hypothetical protein J6W61_03660 [Bacteroidales bacterium]|nr:hypothetical protein [Bacteroidales bacterium]